MELRGRTSVGGGVRLGCVLSDGSSGVSTKVVGTEGVTLMVRYCFRSLARCYLRCTSVVPRDTSVCVAIPYRGGGRVIRRTFGRLGGGIRIVIVRGENESIDTLLITAGGFVVGCSCMYFVRSGGIARLGPRAVNCKFSCGYFRGVLKSGGMMLGTVRAFRRGPELKVLVPPPPGRNSCCVALKLR